MSTVVNKPWGYKEILVEVPGKYTISRLHIDRDSRLSLQVHPKKVESLVVEDNDCWIAIDNVRAKFRRFSCIHIDCGKTHRIETDGCGCRVLEIATMSGDEVVRIEDDYGRV